MGRKSVLQKGKEKVTDGKSLSAGKRKRDSGVVYDEDKHGKRKDRNVLKFFDDVAYEVDDDDDDDFSDDSDFFDEDMMLDEEFGNNAEVTNEPVRTPQIPVIPKEEELEGEELEQMLRERYKPGSSFVSFAEDNDRRRLFKQDTPVPSLKDPTIWKVKCTVGRERHSAFCLMQKYVDLLTLGTRLHIISAFALDHVKGYVYIEADRQPDVYEACKGLCYIYSSRMTPVPMNEVSHLITARSKSAGISEGMWVRVKSGTYKGDLAQVVAVNDARKKVTVKLIPRIDLQAITNKFGGGVASKKRAVPAPRLIGSAELEDFRPLIQYRKDRDTNLTFEVLDGNVLKDGYLYKKVSTDSLSYWGVQPTEAELLKFEPPENDEPQDVEWLTQLYGDRKKKRIATDFKAGQKGGEKGDGSSSSSMESSFEVDDLVFFGRKDFGIIIGKEEKDDSFKIMKDGSERSVVVNLLPRELKRASFDKKLFTVKDQLANTISIGDMVKVLDGPSKERQGIVKQIYKGVVFLYDQSEQENNGYLCVKGTVCERITGGGGLLKEKGSEPGPSGFADYPSSPKSPLSPEKSWKERDGSSNFKREDKDGMFSVGQSLRIRVGPLKGYLCRVLAIRRFDVTVKLDSQKRILSVKPEHLAEVHQKSSVMSLGVDGDSAKPFDLLGTQDGSEADWLVQGTEGNTGAPPSSTERSSWPAFPASSLSVPTGSVADDTNAGDSAWETRATTQSQNTSWGASGVSERTVAGSGQDDGWSKPDGWGKATSAGTTSGVSGGWGKNVESNQESTEKSMEGSWDKSVKTQGNNVGTAGWGSLGNAPTKPTEGWGSTGGSSAQTEADTSGWKKAAGATGGQGQNSWSKPDAGSSDGASSWGKQSDAKAETDWKKQDGGSNKSDTKAAWGQQDAGSSWKKSDGEGGSPWGKKADVNTETDCKKQDGGSSWNRPESKTLSSQQDAGSSWKKSEGEGRSSWGKQPDTKAENNWKSPDGGSSWSKADGSKTSWSKQDDAKSSWNKKDDGSFTKQAGGTSWDKGSGGSAWNKGDVSDRAEDSSKPTWGKQDGGGTWSKQDAGSSWEGSGGSAWNKKGDGSGGAEDKSTWGKQDGAASWGRQAAGGSESWKKPGAFDSSGKEQEGSWGRPRDFDGGRGSGGRRGRGGWRGGGRDQGGRGRSFNQGQSSSWTTEAEGNNNSAFKGNQSSWNNSQEHSWGNTSFEGSKKADSWSQPVASSKDDDFSEKKQGWNAAKPSGGGGWNASKLSNEGLSSSWNKNSAAEEVGGSGGNQSDWGKKSGEVGGATGWGTSGSNQSAGWDKKIPQKDVEQDENGKNQNDPWSSKKASDGGSSTGGGHSNWKSGTNDSGGTQDSWSSKSNWKSGTSDSGGNQDSWSNKSNWSSGSGFNDNNQQSGTYGDRGGRGGGSWRGGRGGSDRGGYGGRGGSERGGFGGRGGFRGRGSDGGGFRGRGSDGGGFRGRGRGRRDDSGGDWQNRNDSQEDKPYGGWSKGSGSDAEGWKSNNKGSWSQGNSDKGSWKSGDNGGGTGGGTGGGWSIGFGSEKNEIGSGSGATSWNNTQGNSWKASATTGGTSSGWGQQSAKEDQNGMGKSWDSGNASTAWTASKSNTEDVDKSKDTSDGPSDAWGKAASSWDKGKTSGSQGGW